MTIDIVPSLFHHDPRTGYHELLLNTGNANFVLHSRIEDPYKDNYFTAELTCVETIDFDSDGYLDLYLGYSMMPNVILRNQGPGTSFIRHYDAGSLTADVDFTYATRVLDLNNDGKIAAGKDAERSSSPEANT